MRDIYYQSVENPVQLERLPAEPLTIAQLYRAPPRSKDDTALKWPAKACILATIAGAITLIPVVPRFALPVLSILAFCYFCCSVSAHAPVVTFIFLAITGSLGFFAPTLTPLLPLLALPLLCHRIGTNYIYLVTCTPTAPTVAAEHRERLGAELVWRSFVPTVIIIAAAYAFAVWQQAGPNLVSYLIGGFIAALAVFLIHDAKPRSFSRATGLWFGYNIEGCTLLGIAQSPVGHHRYRPFLTILVVATVGSAFSLPFDVKTIAIFALAPVAITALSVYVAVGSICTRAEANTTQFASGTNWWNNVRQQMQAPFSNNEVEQRSVYMGSVVHDNSPIVVPRDRFAEHVHIVGDSGSGKTSRGVIPLIEQLFSNPRSTLIVLDLKADSLELLSSMRAAKKSIDREYSTNVPLKYFTNDTSKNTFTFNPLQQPHISGLDYHQIAQLLCASLGLHYGAEYGAGYYSSVNAAAARDAVQQTRPCTDFKTLLQTVNRLLSDKSTLSSERKKGATHLQTELEAMAACAALNEVDPDYGITFEHAFSRPEAYYFHLNASSFPAQSEAIARLALHTLLQAAAAAYRHPEHQVYLFVDEFQTIAAKNLGHIIRTARSMDISLLLANQGMETLKDNNMLAELEEACTVRMWFGVGGLEDRERISKLSGTTMETKRNKTYSVSSDGKSNQGYTESEEERPRLINNDIIRATDIDEHYIFLLKRSGTDGYAQYGGYPFVAELYHHIDAREYEERKRERGWPDTEPGTMTPGGPKPRETAPDMPSQSASSPAPAATAASTPAPQATPQPTATAGGATVTETPKPGSKPRKDQTSTAKDDAGKELLKRIEAQLEHRQPGDGNV